MPDLGSDFFIKLTFLLGSNLKRFVSLSLLGCLGIVLGQRKVFLLNLEYSKASFYSSVAVLVSHGFPIGKCV